MPGPVRLLVSDGLGCVGVKGSLRRPAAALDPGSALGTHYLENVL